MAPTLRSSRQTATRCRDGSVCNLRRICSTVMLVLPVSTPRGVLEPSPDGLAVRVGGQSRTHRPVIAGSGVVFIGYIVMTALLIGLGLILTKLLLSGPVGAWDNSVNRWFVTQRTTPLNSVSSVGSTLGATLTIIGIAVAASIVLAIVRHWRELGFVAAGLTLEASVALTSSIVVNRARPNVPRLDAAPATGSFPSGHTAAAIVLYVSLALVITSHVRSATVRVLAWLFAVAIPIYVGISRLYRGMHHPTDEIGSAVIAAGALLFALLACRTAGVVLHERTAKAERVASDPIDTKVVP
jgi:membrane-associated phospholipid phosphatase